MDDLYLSHDGDGLYRLWREDAARLAQRARWAKEASLRLASLNDAVKSKRTAHLAQSAAEWMLSAGSEQLAVFLSCFIADDPPAYSLLRLLRSMNKSIELLTFERWRGDSAADNAAYAAVWPSEKTSDRRSEIQKAIVALPSGKHKAGQLRNAVAASFARDKSALEKAELKEILKTADTVYRTCLQVNGWLSAEFAEPELSGDLFQPAARRGLLSALLGKG